MKRAMPATMSQIWNWKLFSLVAQGNCEVSRPADSSNMLYPKDLSNDQRKQEGGKNPKKVLWKIHQNVCICIHGCVPLQTDRCCQPTVFIVLSIYFLLGIL